MHLIEFDEHFIKQFAYLCKNHIPLSLMHLIEFDEHFIKQFAYLCFQ